jgi:hypothetical protein
MKKFIIIVGAILLGVFLFSLLLHGDNSLFGITKNGMLNNIEFIKQIP